ncbi:hypothetical protein QCA50_020509 [Cerrena zonata]|uniref:Endonuclease LCL3 n=1 Tax=Cerrena zonata TaxID=2478898 RepID=A0AAW0FIT1_9APHY
MVQLFAAKVKNVLSADTLVLVPTKTAQFPAPERLLTLSYVRGHDSFETKEFLRQLLIGKEIKFKVLYKIPASGKEFGNLTEDDDSTNEFIQNLYGLQNKAKSQSIGIWDDSKPKIELIQFDDSILEKVKQNSVGAIVEKVISGDRIVTRLLLNKSQHSSTPIILAGIKCPRTDDSTNVKIAQQAKVYVEDKLLTTKSNIKVKVIGENQTGLPIGIIEHPSGNNIHEKLLENGFAEVVDWQSTLVGSTYMSGLRRAEQSAKSLAKGLFSNSVSAPAPSTTKVIGSKNLKPGSSINNVTVAKVINADTLNFRLPNSEEEITVQLASLRAPRPNDLTVTSNKLQQQALVNTAREFVRNQVIGKTGQLYIDGYREANADLGLDSRFLVSFKFGNQDLSELLVNNGWASVIKHNKATSHERSLNWDRLVELEEKAKNDAKKGIWFSGDINKILTVVKREELEDITLISFQERFNSIHEIAASSNKYYDELVKSEESAKELKKGVWSNYDPKEAARKQDEETANKLLKLSIDSKPQFFDIEVTDIDTSGIISYHKLDASTVKKFSEFKNGFGQFHSQLPSASSNSTDLPFNLTKPPKKAELVSAKFSENGKYYRGRVVNFDKSTNEYQVKHIDFGNIDQVPLSSLRLLPSQFNLTQYPPFAHTCQLQNIKLPPTKPTDYLTEALYTLEDLSFDKKLVLSALPSSTNGVDFDAVLYDSEQSLKDPTYTINKQLVSEGWGIVDSKLVKSLVADYVKEITNAQQTAKKQHLGCWEFGDVSFDEDNELDLIYNDALI